MRTARGAAAELAHAQGASKGVTKFLSRRAIAANEGNGLSTRSVLQMD